MHTNLNYSDITKTNLIQVNFNKTIKQSKLSEIINNKIENREYFYGIEILPQTLNHNSLLDYNSFEIQPLFTSIIWIGEIYADFEPFKNSPPLQCIKMIQQCSIVMPHLTCYQMTNKKIQQVLTDNISNVLVLQGDKVHKNQNFKHAIDLIKEIRNLKNNNISIGVAGYPECHPNSNSLEEDLNYLKEKIDAGADFIITQLCFSEENIKKFVQNCRYKGIMVPIIPGIFIPESFQSLIKMIEITKIKLPLNLLEKYESLKNDKNLFQKFAQENIFNIIRNLFDSNLGIYGVQFFTLNHFDRINDIVKKLFVN